MLRTLNQLSHGFVIVPVVKALEEGGLFALLADRRARSLDELVAALQANPGPLRIALDMAVVLGVMIETPDGYAPGDHPLLAAMPDGDLMALYAHSPLELLSAPEGVAVMSPWLDRAAAGWDADELTAALLDGPIILPLLVGTMQGGLLEDLLRSDATVLPVSPAVRRLLLARRWVAESDQEGFGLTALGKFLFGRAMVCGVTASYYPLLNRLRDLLFGDADSVMAPVVEPEIHVDRTLNVQASGFTHEKFFADMDKVIAALLSVPEAAGDGPVHVADMGCGDGTLLKRIYGVAADKVGVEAVMVGVDLNQAALDETAKTLGTIPHVLLQGDIGDPAGLLRDLTTQLGGTPERLLHVRSFLDHNRRFVAPSDDAAVAGRARLGAYGSGIGPAGSLVTAAEIHQSQVEHLRAWRDILRPGHGLLLLEVHAMSPWAKAAYLELAEGFHFDAHHAFSKQYLCAPSVFLASMAEAGLFPEALFRPYPKGLPYTRITLGYYEARPYSVRFATPADAAALAAVPWAAAQGFDAEVAATLAEAEPALCMLLVDEAGTPRAGVFLSAEPFDAEAERQVVRIGQAAAETSDWGQLLMRHLVIYCGLRDGTTALEGSVPNVLRPGLDGLAALAKVGGRFTVAA